MSPRERQRRYTLQEAVQREGPWTGHGDPHRQDDVGPLFEAEEIGDHQYPNEELYWLRFDRSRLAGYQGSCFKRLYHHDDARTHSFLQDAQRALTDALALLDPARIQRRPALLIDVASTYAQQENVERACERAIEALSITAQTKSRTVVQRLFTLRSELEPWKETQDVRNLDEQIALFIPLGGYRGIAYRNGHHPKRSAVHYCLCSILGDTRSKSCRASTSSCVEGVRHHDPPGHKVSRYPLGRATYRLSREKRIQAS